MITVNLVSCSANALPDHSLDSSSDIISEEKMLKNFSRYKNRAVMKIVAIIRLFVVNFSQRYSRNGKYDKHLHL